MGRLRLRICDGNDREQTRGSLENAASVELEIRAAPAPSLLRIRDADGALLSLVALRAGGPFEFRSAAWPAWSPGRQPVDQLHVTVRLPEPGQDARAELRDVDQVWVRQPLSDRDQWELTVISGGNQPSAHTVQSVFCVLPPWLVGPQAGPGA
jgi:hypothetical protein